MRELSPVVGNPRLLDAIRGKDRLTPTWAILPHQTGEQAPPEECLRQMAACNVRALWSWDRQHRYLLSRFGMGDLLALLEERRVPLLMMVDLGQGPFWSDVEALLRDFPSLTLCAIPAGVWGQDRCYRPLVEAFDRLHIGIEACELAGGIADFVKHYGARRLVYGSGYPRIAMGGCRSMLQRAEIDDADKQAIAADNLDRLLAEARL